MNRTGNNRGGGPGGGSGGRGRGGRGGGRRRASYQQRKGSDRGYGGGRDGGYQESEGGGKGRGWGSVNPARAPQAWVNRPVQPAQSGDYRAPEVCQGSSIEGSLCVNLLGSFCLNVFCRYKFPFVQY